MKVLVIGATGYVGSAVALELKARGHDVYGLARNEANRAALAADGISPVHGDIERLRELCITVKSYELIVLSIMVPLEAEAVVVEALIEACRGGGRHLMFTSGTSVISTGAESGLWSQHSFGEDDPFPFLRRMNLAVRQNTEQLIRAAGDAALRTTIVRPPLIYGKGGGGQIPQIFSAARRIGAAPYIGEGKNLYSNVHIDDLAEIYCLALERGENGALYHSVSGEADFRALAEAVGTVMGCGARRVSYQEATEFWGKFLTDIAFAVNSRSTCPRTLQELGWRPKHIDVIEDIRAGSYRDAYLASGGKLPAGPDLSSHGAAEIKQQTNSG